MQTLIRQLNQAFGDAFEAAGFERSAGTVALSQRPDLCQFQCNGAMAVAKKAGIAPRVAAEKVLATLVGKERYKDLSLAGPGFINISFTDEVLRASLSEAGLESRLGVPAANPSENVVIDFGGPNIAKPMHVGHLRSTIIGDSLQRLHRFLGNKVTSDIHLGDWGTQMGMLIEAVKEEQPGLPYFDESKNSSYPKESPVSLEDLERLYPAMSARCKEDAALADKARLATKDLQSGRAGYRALWRHFVDASIAALKKDLGELGVSFDLWLGESDSQSGIPKTLEELKAKNVAVSSEGALVIMLETEQGSEMPPLLLVKSDGGYLYGTTDLQTLRERVEGLKAQRLLYVADKRQSLHFKQVFQGAKKAGYLGAAHAEHVAFGTVNGKDGKPFKTREGGVMRLQALLAMAVEEASKRMDENEIAKELAASARAKIAKQVGYAAVKFADLSNHRSSDYAFDLEKFTQFEGKTGPYLLYAAVRMKSILRKGAERGFKPGALTEPGDLERPLYLKLLALPEALERAAADSLPHVICEYAHELSGAFSTFYAGCNIVNETDQAKRGSWLALTEYSLKVLGRCLEILGLEAPEQM